jgi:hypothetical protein
MVIMFTAAQHQRAVWASMNIIDIFLNYKKAVRTEMIIRFSPTMPYMKESDRMTLSDHIDSLHPFANKGKKSKRQAARNIMAEAAARDAEKHPERYK